MAESSLVRETIDLEDHAAVRVRVLVVSRRLLFAETVQWALDAAGLEVVAAPDVDAAVAFARSVHPDVVVMDVNSTDGDAVAAERALARADAPCTVLVIGDPPAGSAHTGNGVREILPGTIGLDGLAARIRAAASGEPVVVRTGDRRVCLSPEERHAQMVADSLTGRERQILQLMVSGASGRVIADHLGLSPNTVRTHAQNVLTKLQVGSRLAAVAFAVEHGIVSIPADD
ncbi:MAG TPA: response regulator transcription factor [Actinomycetota bacterium]|nr:response regulator transcription factor [Actinomycetota bacterium]